MFSDIIGNDKLKKELIHSVEINKTSHSYLFIGTEGIGKKLIAEEFAKMLLAVKDTENSPDLLKPLEEPPEFVTIILIGSNEN